MPTEQVRAKKGAVTDQERLYQERRLQDLGPMSLRMRLGVPIPVSDLWSDCIPVLYSGSSSSMHNILLRGKRGLT